MVSGGVGPYTYAWNTTPVQTTATATNLAAGVYTVTVTDNTTACTVISSVDVTDPTDFSTGTAVIDVLCFGDNTGD